MSIRTILPPAAELARDHHAGVSLAELAKRNNCSAKTIRARLLAAGYETVATRPKKKIDPDVVLAAYEQGVTHPELIERFGVGRRAIADALAQARRNTVAREQRATRGQPPEDMLGALCKTRDPELWFRKETEQEAKRICLACPELDTCRRWAIDTRPEYGVAGGMTEGDRETYRRKVAAKASHARRRAE